MITLPLQSTLALRVWALGLCGLAWLGAGAPAPAAQGGSEPGRSEYRRYQVIFERNIFNTRRYARSASAPVERRDTRRAARVDSIALVGTMLYEKGPFAFFDGSSDAYRKALQPNEQVGGFKVTSIGHDYVTLEAGTNQFALHLGKQLRREDQGAWHIADYEPRVAFGVSSGSSSRSSGYDSRRSSDSRRPDEARSEAANFMPPGFGEGGPPPAVMVINGDAGEQVVVSAQTPPDGPPENAPAGPEEQSGDTAAGNTNTGAGRTEAPVDEITRRLMERRAQELNR